MPISINNSITGTIGTTFYTDDIQEIACQDGYGISSKPSSAEGNDSITAVCTLYGAFDNIPSCEGKKKPPSDTAVVISTLL